MPPVPNGFIAYVHASYMQKVFYIPQREWKLTYSITASLMIAGLVLK